MKIKNTVFINIICPVFQEQNLKSRVSSGPCMTTLVGYFPYYDEDGKYHDHDGNTKTTDYNCSMGHYFSISQTGTCPSCDFGKDTKKVTIHDKAQFTYF